MKFIKVKTDEYRQIGEVIEADDMCEALNTALNQHGFTVIDKPMDEETWKELDEDGKIEWLELCAMSEKEACEIVCDNMYDLPIEIAELFSDFNRSKWKKRTHE